MNFRFTEIINLHSSNYYTVRTHAIGNSERLQDYKTESTCAVIVSLIINIMLEREW